MSQDNLEQHPRVAVKSNGSKDKPAKGVGVGPKIAQRGGDIPANVPPAGRTGDHLSNSIRMDGPPRTAERGGQSIRGHVRGQVASRPMGSKDTPKIKDDMAKKARKDTKGLSITGVK